MNVPLIVGCLLLLYLWFRSRFLEHAKKIVGCQHKRGELVPAVKDRWGLDTALVWMCHDCPFQIPLKLVRLAGKYETWIRQEELDRNRKDHR